jgi:uncharacterized protein YbjT (DUF2867 family)
MTTPPALPALAVTGATGALGGLVARGLAEHGVQQRLLVRTPSKAPDLPGATVLPAAYEDTAACLAALDGVATLFMVSGTEGVVRVGQHRSLVDAAASAGVEHVVYTSFFGAAPDAVFTHGREHFATEQVLREAGMRWTFLRDNFYLDILPHLAGEDGVIRGPAGSGRVAAVARADIAAVATAVLLDPSAHRDATYGLTGPEALTLEEVAAVLTAHGDPVTYHEETVEEAYASRRQWEAPEWEYDAWVSTYTAIAAGEVAPVTDDVERLTGRTPMSLAEYLRRG